MTINDDVFRTELDKQFKLRKLLKRERDILIGRLIRQPVNYRDALLDKETSVTNAYLQKRREDTKVPSEHTEQAAFVHWFRHIYPDVLIYAIPNGGLRGDREAQALVLEGVVKGVADLFIDDWNCYVEFKRSKGGTWGAEQERFCNKVRSNGKTYLLVHGLDDAKLKINSFKLK